MYKRITEKVNYDHTMVCDLSMPILENYRYLTSVTSIPNLQNGNFVKTTSSSKEENIGNGMSANKFRRENNEMAEREKKRT